MVCSKDIHLFDDLRDEFGRNFTFRVSDIVDPGVVQSDAVTVDYHETFNAQFEFEQGIPERLDSEKHWLLQAKPALVLIDASPYPIPVCKVSYNLQGSKYQVHCGFQFHI